MDLNFRLNDFEGPLDLLVYLVKKDKMDIFDIDINVITEQYLTSIKDLKSVDLEKAGDFIFMASTLIQLKAQILLKDNTKEDDEELEDPREALSQKLIEYMKVKKYSMFLYKRKRLFREYYLRTYRENLTSDPNLEIAIEEKGAFLLGMAYRGMLKKETKKVHKVQLDIQDVSNKIDQLKKILKIGERIEFSKILSQKTKEEVLINFLGLLELSQKGCVSLFQSREFDEIYVETLEKINHVEFKEFSY